MVAIRSHAARFATPWQSRDLRFLLGGEAVRLLGTQFYFLALPWLTLQLAGSVFAPGIMTVLGAVPRLALMPLGGILTDRLSARTLVLGTSIARGVLLAVFSVLVASGTITLVMVGVFCTVWGAVEAFSAPARAAMVPVLLPREQIQPGNGLALAAEQVWELLSPALVGLTIHGLGRANMGVPLAIAALANGGTAALLAQITPRARQAVVLAPASPSGGLAAFRPALAHAWRDRALRTPLLILVLAKVLIQSPLWLALPVLAKLHLSDGIAALGLLTSAVGGGALLGAVLAGSLPAPSARGLRPFAAGMLLLSGAGLVVLYLTHSTWVATLAALTIGVAFSTLNTVLLTWVQRHTPPAFMGRMMSLAAMR
jgi:MFS family permease